VKLLIFTQWAERITPPAQSGRFAFSRQNPAPALCSPLEQAWEAATDIQVEPIEVNGKHYVGVAIDGTAMEPRGPYPDSDTAELAAAKMRAMGRTLNGGDRG
jgi:hypothetical protein